MGNKIAFSFLVIVGVISLCLAGFVIGANYGGNYADTYVALGTVGYEATGAIGGSLGIIFGIILGSIFYHKFFCKEAFCLNHF